MANNIVTYTGKIFDLLNPKPEMVCIEDIAHSLAYQCRYTGHTREFYSVAQHCVLMAENKDLLGDSMAKLMHDADEAYLGDIARPWKNLLLVWNYNRAISCPVPVREFEGKIQDVIGLALGIDLNHSAEVTESDIRMMATEIRDLMPIMPDFSVWNIRVKGNNPVKELINPWPPFTAEMCFLELYYELKGDRC